MSLNSHYIILGRDKDGYLVERIESIPGANRSGCAFQYADDACNWITNEGDPNVEYFVLEVEAFACGGESFE